MLSEPAWAKRQIVLSAEEIVCQVFDHHQCKLFFPHCLAEEGNGGGDVDFFLLGNGTGRGIIDYNLTVVELTHCENSTFPQIRWAYSEPIGIVGEYFRKYEVG
ncbi:hypothetical protein [Mycobacterium sp. MS1601]|uniref:hypothetical protein n=1 Tax=Mycobacterium sp. MS1601 TaxID=1936029 RepID=UPI0012FCC667|nr:hypothetical protein [Mycobacterium sp. MS1601]